MSLLGCHKQHISSSHISHRLNMFSLRTSNIALRSSRQARSVRHMTAKFFPQCNCSERKRKSTTLLAVGGVFIATSSLCTVATAATDEQAFVETASGLKYRDSRVGEGAQPRKGDTVKVHYTGWLDGFDGQKKFDSSLDRGTPLEFAAGVGRVIPGWDEALLTMQVGSVREVIIPSQLGYGQSGAGGMIPPGATLYFRMDLVDTSPPGFVKGLFNKIF